FADDLQRRREQQEDAEHHRQHLRDEAEGLLLHRRQRLEQAHHQADHEPDEEHGPREHHRREQELASEVVDLQIDGAEHLDQVVMKLVTTEWQMRCHPSTSTKTRILNGVEIITGGSMNMPIESRMLATTRSMTKKGRNSK